MNRMAESGTIMQQEQTNNGSPFYMRYLEIFDRVHQFHDRREDNERARPLPEHPTERANVGSTDEKNIRGFKLKYNLLCENLRSNVIEQKDMADVRVSLRSVNELWLVR